MESTSRPYRIHVSDAAHNKLEHLGGYKMEFRGVTQVKGKGAMNTYWLYGKEGYDKWLPEPAPDTSSDHGYEYHFLRNLISCLKLLRQAPVSFSVESMKSSL